MIAAGRVGRGDGVTLAGAGLADEHDDGIAQDLAGLAGGGHDELAGHDAHASVRRSGNHRRLHHNHGHDHAVSIFCVACCSPLFGCCFCCFYNPARQGPTS